MANLLFVILVAWTVWLLVADKFDACDFEDDIHD